MGQVIAAMTYGGEASVDVLCSAIHEGVLVALPSREPEGMRPSRRCRIVAGTR